eukprot:Rmarinus@m.20588
MTECFICHSTAKALATVGPLRVCKDCFMCSVCEQSLQGKIVTQVGGKLVCKNCHEHSVPQGSSCPVCEEPLKGTVAHVGGFKFHKPCFACYWCKSSFDGGGFALVAVAEGKPPVPACKGCAEQRTGGGPGSAVGGGETNKQGKAGAPGAGGTTPAPSATRKKSDGPSGGPAGDSDRKPSVPMCYVCEKGLTGQYITAGPYKLHLACFRCEVCAKAFGVGSAPLLNEGKFFCPTCVQLPKCAACSEQIQGPIQTALKKDWHPSCFTCELCQKPFPDGRFLEREGLPYHVQCAEEKFASKCVHCGLPIIGPIVKSSTGRLEGEMCFHPDCFCCMSCGNTFTDGLYVPGPGGQSVLCSACTESMHSMCAGCLKPVTGSDRVSVAFGQTYHEDCVRCATCHNHISEGICQDASGSLFCDACYQVPACAGCAEPITTDDALSAMGAAWHCGCFKCFVCGSKCGEYRSLPKTTVVGGDSEADAKVLVCEMCYTTRYQTRRKSVLNVPSGSLPDGSKPGRPQSSSDSRLSSGRSRGLDAIAERDEAPHDSSLPPNSAAPAPSTPHVPASSTPEPTPSPETKPEDDEACDTAGSTRHTDTAAVPSGPSQPPAPIQDLPAVPGGASGVSGDGDADTTMLHVPDGEQTTPGAAPAAGTDPVAASGSHAGVGVDSSSGQDVSAASAVLLPSEEIEAVGLGPADPKTSAGQFDPASEAAGDVPGAGTQSSEGVPAPDISGDPSDGLASAPAPVSCAGQADLVSDSRPDHDAGVVDGSGVAVGGSGSITRDSQDSASPLPGKDTEASAAAANTTEDISAAPAPAAEAASQHKAVAGDGDVDPSVEEAVQRATELAVESAMEAATEAAAELEAEATMPVSGPVDSEKSPVAAAERADSESSGVPSSAAAAPAAPA